MKRAFDAKFKPVRMQSQAMNLATLLSKSLLA